MGTEAETQAQLERTCELLQREVQGLLRTRERLRAAGPIDAAWVDAIGRFPEREDLAESFGSKFNRLQDTIGDKLLPRFFQWMGEKPLPFLDNLRRAERYGLVGSAERFLQARELRNKLVHEYVEDPDEFAQALNLADSLVEELLETYRAIEDYIATRQ